MKGIRAHMGGMSLRSYDMSLCILVFVMHKVFYPEALAGGAGVCGAERKPASCGGLRPAAANRATCGGGRRQPAVPVPRQPAEPLRLCGAPAPPPPPFHPSMASWLDGTRWRESTHRACHAVSIGLGRHKDEVLSRSTGIRYKCYHNVGHDVL